MLLSVVYICEQEYSQTGNMGINLSWCLETMCGTTKQASTYKWSKITALCFTKYKLLSTV